MDILKELQQTIELLTNSPSSIDVQNIRSILVNSYDVVRDGLKRSQNADQYVNIKNQAEILTGENTRLTAQVASLSAELDKLKPQISQFDTLFSDLKNKLAGKLQLLNSFTPEYKAVLAEQISKATPDIFYHLKVQIESAFTGQWSGANLGSALASQSNVEFVDVKHFKSGR